MFRILKNNRGTWGAVAGAVVSVAAGAASSSIKKSTATDGEQGYDMPMLTNSPYDAANQQLSAQLAQNMASNSMQGRLAPGVELLMDRIRKQKLLESKEAMYGKAGQRGGSIMDNTMAMGSMGGVGPKAMMASGSRAMGDYASRNAQIQNYMDGLKMTGLQQQQTNALSAMQSMPRSNEIPYNGNIVDMSTAGTSGMDTGLQNVDWGSFMNNTGFFNKEPQNDPVGGGTFTGDTINYGNQNYPITAPPQSILSQYDSYGRRIR